MTRFVKWNGFFAIVLAAWCAGCVFGPKKGSDLTLVDAAKTSDYEIVTAAQPSASAREGAQELQRLIEKTTGARLPIVTEPAKGRRHIVLGAHPLAEKAGIRAGSFGADGFDIRAIRGDLYLVGKDDDQPQFFSFSRDRISSGTYFAVIEFARQFLGVEWYMPGPLGEEAPPREGLKVPADLRYSGKPRFPNRFLDIVQVKNGELQQRMGYDTNRSVELASWGRRLRLGSSIPIDGQHAWFLWVPPEEPNTWGGSPRTYGAEHPEYFALYNGKRQNFYANNHYGMGAQLCVANPEVARVCASNMIAYAKRTGQRFLPLSENDGGGHCECESCRAWDVVKGKNPKARPGLGDYVLTDRIYRFANNVADLVVREVPDIRIGVLAYHNTLSAPLRVRPHDAIVVTDVYNSWPIVFHESASRQMLETHMRQWRERCARIQWHAYYFNNGYNWSLPWSTLDAQVSVAKLLADYPSSLGMSVCYGFEDGAPMGVLGPDPWIVSQLLWDPTQSVEALKERFYAGAFGPQAGPSIRKYFETIDAAFGKAIAAKFDGKPDMELSQRSVLIPVYQSVRAECRALIDQAVAAVSQQPERYRWRTERIARAWRYAELTLDGIAATQTAREATPANRQAAWEKAAAIGRERLALALNTNSLFSLSPSGVDWERESPLGVVTQIPASEACALIIPKAEDSIVVDGKLDESVWQKAGVTSDFKENKDGGTPRAATRARAWRDSKGLYVGFECQEPAMKELQAIDDPAQLWSGDVVELFLMPSTAGGNEWFHFSVNPNGIGRALRGPSENWKKEWRHAAARTNDRWTAELFIPWASVGTGAVPKNDEEWRGNFGRERYPGKFEVTAWSPTGGGFAAPMRFGRLRF
ncbi:MAG: DUF4838 domain-containing protein [Kiritimatiellae bacterium]|nr:DUF4838 domain-containing protein [Kiritimatiellia bacterium]